MTAPLSIVRSSSPLSPQTLILCGELAVKIQEIARLSSPDLVAINTIADHVLERLHAPQPITRDDSPR